MGSKQRDIVLSDDLVKRCLDAGQARVDGYKRGDYPKGLALSSHGAELNPVLQANSVGGECAFAIWGGKDPLRAVKWKPVEDGGHDIQFYCFRVDVKTIDRHKKLLIWPVNKKRLFMEKDFTTLVLVKGELPKFTIAKWISKEAFYNECSLDELPGITPGTPWMKEEDLWSISTLCKWTGYQEPEEPVAA